MSQSGATSTTTIPNEIAAGRSGNSRLRLRARTYTACAASTKVPYGCVAMVSTIAATHAAQRLGSRVPTARRSVRNESALRKRKRLYMRA